MKTAERRLKEIKEAKAAWENFYKVLCEELHLEQLVSWLNEKLKAIFGVKGQSA